MYIYYIHYIYIIRRDIMEEDIIVADDKETAIETTEQIEKEEVL